MNLKEPLMATRGSVTGVMLAFYRSLDTDIILTMYRSFLVFNLLGTVRSELTLYKRVSKSIPYLSVP